MLRAALWLHSVALHGGRHAPFVEGALQLHQLHLAHRQAREDYQHLLRSSDAAGASPATTSQKGNGKKKDTSALVKQEEVCLALEREFLREVEALRPIFTLTATLEVSRLYAQHIYTALHYFGAKDDPLVRQLGTLVGRAAMKQQQGRWPTPPPSTASRHHSHPGAAEEEEETGKTKRGRGTARHPLEEHAVTTLPSELPHPPQVEWRDERRRRLGALRMPLAHRGHWVLQEPEIAITREERKEDPW